MEMVWSSSFHFKKFLGQTRKERERERERARERKERKPKSCRWHRRRTPSSSPTIGRTRSRRSHHAPRRSISPSISPPCDPAFDPPISLCDFDFCCCCGGVVVVFWWLWLSEFAAVGLHWSYGGVWCWDLAVICSVDWDLAVILKFSVIKFVWMLRK